MASETIKDVKELLANGVLIYGVLRSDPKKAIPIELDDDGNVYVNTGD